MDDSVWRPSRTQSTDQHGVVWRRHRRWLDERTGRRLMLRASVEGITYLLSDWKTATGRLLLLSEMC